jgi:hypothetical protein
MLSATEQPLVFLLRQAIGAIGEPDQVRLLYPPDWPKSRIICNKIIKRLCSPIFPVMN